MKLKTIRQQYMILSSQFISEEVREMIESNIKTLSTGQAVVDFAYQNYPVYSSVRLNGPGGSDVVILKWRGVDVAVFYKRQITRVQPDHDGVNDGTPSKALRSEDEAWTKMSLLDAKSSMKQAQFYSEEYSRVKDENESLQKQVRSLSHLNDMLSEKISKMEMEKESKLKSSQKGS